MSRQYTPIKTATRCTLTRADGTGVTLTCSRMHASFLRKVYQPLGFVEIEWERLS